MRMALRPGGPIRQSSVHRLLAPTRGNIAAWHDLHRLPSRAISHLLCSNTSEVEHEVSTDFDLVHSPVSFSNVRSCDRHYRLPAAPRAADGPCVCQGRLGVPTTHLVRWAADWRSLFRGPGLRGFPGWTRRDLNP